MIKNEKGSVTLLVAVTVLLIIIILSSSLTLVSLKRKSQLQESKILQEIYGGDNLNEIYHEQLEKKNYSNLVSDSSSGSGSISASDITPDLYGKYVDIGLDIDGNGDTINDWELFYVNEDRIFLIAADDVPTEKLEDWNVIGNSTTLGKAGFRKYNSDKYSVYWAGTPTQFLALPDLGLIMHNVYSLETNKSNTNSIAVSQLLNKDAWNGIKTAASADKQEYIDFVIGGPTIEMWCAAWNKAVEGDEDFIKITANTKNDYGYYISSDKIKDQTNIYMNGTTSSLGNKLTKLAEKYKTFFPHIQAVNDCYGYWIASPSASGSNTLVFVGFGGSVYNLTGNGGSRGVRPIVCLKSETTISWNSEKKVFEFTSSKESSRKYNIADGIMVKNSLRKGPVTLENLGASRVGNISSYAIDEQNGIYVNDESSSTGYWFNYDFVASDGYSTSLNLDHIYYASIECKLSSGSLSFGFFNSFHKNNEIVGVNANVKTLTTTSDTFSKISIQCKPSKNPESSTYESDYMDSLQFGSSKASLSEFYIRNLMMLDLTEIFGEGNEPTQEWCDANINFDTTIVTK